VQGAARRSLPPPPLYGVTRDVSVWMDTAPGHPVPHSWSLFRAPPCRPPCLSCRRCAEDWAQA